MDTQAAFQAIVQGRVQGVNFRAFVYQKAHELELSGFTRNLPSGNEVEVQAAGRQQDLEKLLDLLKQGPLEARVDAVNTTWLPFRGKSGSFDIRY
jgi:acylphosphatase